MPSQVSYDNVRAPRGWLLIAFLGIWLYVVSQVLQYYRDQVADAAGLSVPEVLRVLAFTTGLGSLLVFSGLIAALWRANLAAGLSPAGVQGLVMGAGGVGILILFQIAYLLDLFKVVDETLAALLRSAQVGNVMGTALAFAGLASLAVGLTHAAGLFRPSEEGTPSTTASDRPT